MPVPRPFASLLLLSGLILALFGAVLFMTAPTQGLSVIFSSAIQDWAHGSVLRLVCTVAGPAIFTLALSLLVRIVWRALREVRRQCRATSRVMQGLAPRTLAVDDATVVCIGRQIGLARLIDVIPYTRPFALCHGPLFPRICVSTALLARLGPGELLAVLRHERAHVWRRDPLRLLVARAAAASLPFLPIVAQLAAAVPAAQDLAADRAVLKEQDGCDLARALLVFANQDEKPAVLPLALSIAGSLEARIDQLAGAPMPAPRASLRALARAMLVMGGLTLAFLPSVLHPHSSTGTAGPGSIVCAIWHCVSITAVLVVLVVSCRRDRVCLGR